MGGAARDGGSFSDITISKVLIFQIGGKAKPLKAPKKEKKELDEDDLAYKAKLKAGMGNLLRATGITNIPGKNTGLICSSTDAKANKDMAEKAKGKGPMNGGQQGIKKSGKK